MTLIQGLFVKIKLDLTTVMLLGSLLLLLMLLLLFPSFKLTDGFMLRRELLLKSSILSFDLKRMFCFVFMQREKIVFLEF